MALGSAFVSGAALPHLTYVVARALVFPFHATLWLGGEVFAALALFALWHFGVWPPTLGLVWTDVNAASNAFASLADESGEYVGYFGILPALAVGASATALALSALLRLPIQIMVPTRRLFAGLKKNKKKASAADWGRLVLGTLVSLAALLPYELTARFSPADGMGPLTVLLVGAITPPVVTCVAALVLRLATATVAKLTVASAALSVLVPLLVYYEAVFDLCWILGAAVLAVMLLGAAIFYCVTPRVLGKVEEDEEDAGFIRT